jgi:uncharacterized SAM-binding protein YcdF (DUF218 family)
MNQKAEFQRRMKRSVHFKTFMTLLTLVTILVLACVVFFSGKAGGLLLTACIEQSATSIAAPAGKAAQAIVVLTGGDLRNQEAARQYRETGLPVLASGGDGEAARIKKQLETEFHVPVKWTEDKALNTEQNAIFSAKILAIENIQSIILVTHALHMRRARMMFLDQGLEVISAPTDYSNHTALEWRDFLPSAEGRKLTQSALHEIVGLAWFRIRQIIA